MVVFILNYPFVSFIRASVDIELMVIFFFHFKFNIILLNHLYVCDDIVSFIFN